MYAWVVSQEEGFQNITERHCGQFVQKKGNQKRSKNCRCSRLRPCRVGRGQGQGRACQPAGEAAACPDPQGRSGRRGKEGGNWEMTAGLPRGFAGWEETALTARVLASSCLRLWRSFKSLQRSGKFPFSEQCQPCLLCSWHLSILSSEQEMLVCTSLLRLSLNSPSCYIKGVHHEIVSFTA